MTVKETIFARRTIRKFTQEKIPYEKLTEFVDCARVAAYPANMQPLKFAIVDDKDTLDALFPFTKWAGALENGTPKEDERPTAYIAVLGDKTIKPDTNGYEVEAGAAVTTMMLAAQETGIATCWLGAIERGKIHERLNLPDSLCVVYLLALGYPNQKSRMVEMTDFKYYESEDGTINVPKRSLDEVLIKIS